MIVGLIGTKNNPEKFQEGLQVDVYNSFRELRAFGYRKYVAFLIKTRNSFRFMFRTMDYCHDASDSFCGIRRLIKDLEDCIPENLGYSEKSCSEAAMNLSH